MDVNIYSGMHQNETEQNETQIPNTNSFFTCMLPISFTTE